MKVSGAHWYEEHRADVHNKFSIPSLRPVTESTKLPEANPIHDAQALLTWQLCDTDSTIWYDEDSEQNYKAEFLPYISAAKIGQTNIIDDTHEFTP